MGKGFANVDRSENAEALEPDHLSHVEHIYIYIYESRHLGYAFEHVKTCDLDNLHNLRFIYIYMFLSGKAP